MAEVREVDSTCRSPAIVTALHVRISLKSPSVAFYVVECTFSGGFESLSLRHAVLDAEKLGCIPPKIAGKRRNSATLALKPDQRICPAVRLSQTLPPFSLEATHAVRFQRIQSANAIRSETDGLAKGSLTF